MKIKHWTPVSHEVILIFQVANYTYTCSHAHQPITIKVLSNGWLHKGAIVCPPCRELCEEEFKKRNEYCKPGEEAPPSIYYPHDELQCRAVSYTYNSFLLFGLIAVVFLGGISWRYKCW